MKIAGIDFPGALLNALRDGELVVFAGAGVSMGEPACLPSFKNLAKTIAKGTGKTLHCRDPIDRFLGELQHEGVKVHERAAEILSRNGLEPTELHRNLLKLYSGVEQIRVVTTNFDLLFEQAAENLFGNVLEVFRAPALPLGRQFNGIVHLHGAVSTPSEMVITDEAFGRAYMTEGWAARFLVELFSNFTILFVGYSYDDTIMSYLTRALPPWETDRHFALTQENNFDAQRWRLLEIKPITYPQSSENDYSALDGGVRRLADLIRRGAVDWHREITGIAGNLPSLDEETEDLIEYAFTDATRTRFFTKAATVPEWIDWLDKREYLNPLFLDSTLSERDEIFSRWLVEQFSYTYANILFLLIGKHNMRLHPRFWYDLAYRIGRDRETSWNKDILSRWVSLLLATVQGSVNANSQGLINTSTLLQWMGERCIQHEMLDSLLQIFDMMMGNHLRVREGFFWPSDDESDEVLPVNVELPLIGKHDGLRKLWEEGLQLELSQVAEPLLSRVIRRLEDRHITLCAWQNADRNWDPTSDSRSAIEPHEQDRYPRAIDVLIDVARDCLEWLTSNQIDVAVQWCVRLVHSDAPLLGRLAVHGLSEREDLTADNKIDWLLTHVDLHESSIRHEVFWAVRLAYPEISPERREDLIESVRTYPWANGEDSETKKYVARQHFNWFDWLHKSDPNCTLAKQALDEVLAEFPNFEPKEYPDLMYWIGSGGIAPRRSWTPEELQSTPASNQLDNLLSFQVAEGEESNRRTLLNRVAEAATQNFDWGLDLANVLGKTEKWDTDLWSTLIHAWSRMELDENRYSKFLSWLGKVDLYPKHNRGIAEALYALVKNDGPSYALDLLPQANEIAAALWHHLDQPEPIEETDDWLRLAIDYPAWDLANFWLSGFSLWRQHQDPRPTVLSEDYRATLSDIVEDRSLSGKFGRAVLTSDFTFLLAVDEAWTREYLLPLFDPDSDDFQAAWDGFLTGGRLNPAVAEAMAAPFLKAVERINSDLFNQRDRFIKYYIYIFEYLDENPLDRWIPKFFQYASQEQPSETEEPMLFPHNAQETKDYFAAQVGSRLQNMDEAEQQEWWQRWLKRYWENRLNGVPAGEFESGEVANMLDWLPHLTAVFTEAVDLAVRMPQIPSRNCWIMVVLSKIDKNDLWQRFPEAVAKLLLYLWGCNFSRYDWRSARDLIDNLLSSNISSKLKEELEEIKVQL
jgi:hypothetical protein